MCSSLLCPIYTVFFLSFGSVLGTLKFARSYFVTLLHFFFKRFVSNLSNLSVVVHRHIGAVRSGRGQVRQGTVADDQRRAVRRGERRLRGRSRGQLPHFAVVQLYRPVASTVRRRRRHTPGRKLPVSVP